MRLIKMKGISEEKLNGWQMMFEERKERGLTIKAYCQEKNIAPSRFYYYQKMMKGLEISKTIKAHKDKPTDIKPIQIVNTALRENTVIRFILPNSLQCMLPRDMAVHEMKAILEVMMLCC
jgi:hypothetical protein